MTVSSAYNISESDRSLISAMEHLAPAPAIVIQTPAFGEVGENELIHDLFELVYLKNTSAGLHRADSPGRHFAYRNLPCEGSPADYLSFADGLQEVNPFTDEFYGIDAIDMSGWAGKELAGLGWNKLKQHIRENAETDFVFLMKSDDNSAENLRYALQRDCGIPVELISLTSPEPEMIADYIWNRIGFANSSKSSLIEWIEVSSSSYNIPLSYSWADRLTAKIAIERTLLEDPDDLDALLGRADPAQLGGIRKKLGF